MARKKPQAAARAGSGSPARRAKSEQVPGEVASSKASAGSPRSKSSRRPRGTPNRPPLPRWKLWLFRAVAATIAPLLCLILAEVGLRVAGIGYSPSFFAQTSDGQWLYPNSRFGRTFFPHWMTPYPQPSPFSMANTKPKQTLRVFVLGESAAQGYPAPAYGFSRILEVMLRETFPDVHFEMVNTATVAINSNVILPIARQVAEQQPDIVIAYIGNNEVVGPYGAGTVIKSFAPRLWMIRAAIASKQWRLGQLVARWTEGNRPKVVWDGMAMFEGKDVPATDPRLPHVYDHYRENLEDICLTSAGAGADVLVCTIPVNLRESAPFASVHRPDLGAEDRQRFDALFAQGIALQQEARWEEAVEAFQAALAVDDHFAELHYRLARCLMELQQGAKAGEHFRQALEYDALRFRADDAINKTIRQVAEQTAERGVVLVDTARAFAEHPSSVHGLPGNDLFLEHVHLNFEGNYLFARTVFDQLAPIVVRRTGQSAAADPPPEEVCAERLALTPRAKYELYRELLVLMQKPPFTNQADHKEKISRLSEIVDKLRIDTLLTTADDELRIYQTALEAAPDDLYLRYAAADHHSRMRQWVPAIEDLEIVLARVPNHLMALLRASTALNNLGRYDEAIQYANRLLEERPGLAAALEKIGDGQMGKGDFAGAAKSYNEALVSQPKRPRARVKLAECLIELGKLREAMQMYRVVLKNDPKHVEAHLGVARLLEQDGRVDDALKHYMLVMQEDPGNAVARQRIGAIQNAPQQGPRFAPLRVP